jgi:hypothetical protein
MPLSCSKASLRTSSKVVCSRIEIFRWSGCLHACRNHSLECFSVFTVFMQSCIVVLGKKTSRSLFPCFSCFVQPRRIIPAGMGLPGKSSQHHECSRIGVFPSVFLLCFLQTFTPRVFSRPHPFCFAAAHGIYFLDCISQVVPIHPKGFSV